MTKLGQCRINIEPHVFDAVLFSIRTTQIAAAIIPAPRNMGQSSTPLAISTPEKGVNPPTISSVAGVPGFPKPPLLAPAPFSTAPSPSPIPTNFQTQSIGAPLTPGLPTTLVNQTVSNSQESGLTTTAGIVPVNPTIQSKPSQDPVIQMLAQRASTNSELKALMKIVASGSATPEQLRIFQNHIDDLTAILHRQKQMANMTPIAPAMFSGATTFKSTPGPPSLFRPGMSHMTFGQPSPYHPPPQPKAKPVVQPKVDITGVAIEFTGLSTDRFLFPKNTILELSPNGKHLKASFLIIRKGSGKENDKYDESKEYYQPVTIRLDAESPRFFDTILKTVSPPDEVRKYMEDTFNNKPRAKEVKLVMQLPSEDIGVANDDGRISSSAGAAWRHSLLTPAATPAQTAGSQKSSRRKSEDVDQRCPFCFAALSATQMKPGEQAICDGCNVLESVQRMTTTVGQVRSLTLRQTSGPRTLTMFG